MPPRLPPFFFMLVTSPRNNVQISHQARHVFRVLSKSLSSLFVVNNGQFKTQYSSLSLSINIHISYFTPLIPHHLPLSSHGFDPPIMPSQPKIQYKGFPIPKILRWQCQFAKVENLRFGQRGKGRLGSGDYGVEWSVGGLRQGDNKFFKFCQTRKIDPILPSLTDFERI